LALAVTTNIVFLSHSNVTIVIPAPDRHTSVGHIVIHKYFGIKAL